jgi:hypothetical protein
MGYYEAGHMMYVHPGSLVALRDDLVSFYGTAAPAKPKAKTNTKTSGDTKAKAEGGTGKRRGAKGE